MSERKYRKVVNANGWMRKLHVFSFGNSAPRFVGYCPFFWFTWLCILILPITAPFRFICFLLSVVLSVADAAMESLPERKPRKPSDSLLLAFYSDFLEDGLDFALDVWESYDYLVAWVRATPDWENCAKKAVLERDIARVKSSRREKKVRQLSKYAAPIAKTALVAAGVFAAGSALFWLQRLIIKIRWYAVWDSLIYALPYMGWILLFAAGVFAVVYAMVFFCYLVRGTFPPMP